MAKKKAAPAALALSPEMAAAKVALDATRAEPELTDEQKVQQMTPETQESLTGYIKKWETVGQTTSAIDIEATVLSIQAAYAAAKYDPPKTVIVTQSPLHGVASATNMKYLHEALPAATAELETRLRQLTESAKERILAWKMTEQTEAQVRERVNKMLSAIWKQGEEFRTTDIFKMFAQSCNETIIHGTRVIIEAPTPKLLDAAYDHLGRAAGAIVGELSPLCCQMFRRTDFASQVESLQDVEIPVPKSLPYEDAHLPNPNAPRDPDAK